MAPVNTDCRNCGEDASGGSSIPVDNNAEIVAIDYKGPWGGVPACRTCVELHAAAGPCGPAVLDIYEKTIRARNDNLGRCRTLLEQIEELAEQRP